MLIMKLGKVVKSNVYKCQMVKQLKSVDEEGYKYLGMLEISEKQLV